MYKVIILPLAKQDIKEAKKWYNDQKKGLGRRFTDQIKQEIKFIKENPKTIANRYKKVKTAVVKTFPYMIHFRIDKANKNILISAVLHTSQDSKNWKKRT